MRIAFINGCNQHLGLQSIASVLQKGGHEIKIFRDPQLFDDIYIYSRLFSRIFDYKKNIISGLKIYKPNLIGISVVTFFYPWACTMAKMIKKEMDVPIIFGGIHPTSVPERVIKNDFVDMVCVGEGEYPMLELVNSMEQGQIDYSIKNIWFKRNGSIIQNELRPLIEDLDSLPLPENDLFYLSNAYFAKHYCILTSRGCPYSCSYCCNSYLHKLYNGKGKYVRQRSVKNVIQELIEAKKKYGNNINKISFNDDCFGFNMHWLREFTEEYRKNIGFDFFCIMHPNHVSEESLEYLKFAGCRAISIGVQTWDENIRNKLLQRMVSNYTMEQSLRLIKKKKIEVLVDNLFDFPNYNNEEYIRSLLPYTRIKPTRNYFYQLKYYPNTTLTNSAKEKGWLPSVNPAELDDGKKIDGLRLGKTSAAKIDKDTIKMQVLFIIMDIFPAWITNFIIQNKLYRYFVTKINPALLTILRTLLCSDFETILFRDGEFGRYYYFIRKLCLGSLRRMLYPYTKMSILD